MGCNSSKGKYVAADTHPPSDSGPDQESLEPTTIDNSGVIAEIALRVSSIRAKAEEYRAQLQQQVVDIELQKTSQSPSDGVHENAIVIASYRPSEDVGGTALMAALEGERLEIIVRDAGGWAYCRQRGSPQPGWLPASRVAEIAALIADHDSEGAEGLLSAKKGDVVEVVSRHYSGWAYCREWVGPLLPGCADERREGWVTDAYLEDRRSDAMLASKWHRLVLQALDQVVSSSRELEVVLAQAKSEDWRNELSNEWMGQCLAFASWLTSELQSISQAVSQRRQNNGAHATALCDVNAVGPTELTVHKGDRVLVIDAENPDWAWCRSESSGREGWVPQEALEDESASKDDKKPGGSRKLSQEDLPVWVKEGERCQWWSTSSSRYCEVIVSQVDPERREVKVLFAVDQSSWKSISFDHFAQPSERWLLQPPADKALELRNQLPEWLNIGKTASWWSLSQQRCMSVTIREICLKRRMVSVAFDIDKRVRKNVPLFELIDQPEACLLQKNDQGHAKRMAKPRETPEACPEPEGKAPVSLDDTEDSLPRFGSSLHPGPSNDVFHQSAAVMLGDLLSGMQKDLGDMLGKGGLEDELQGVDSSTVDAALAGAPVDADPPPTAEGGDGAAFGSSQTPPAAASESAALERSSGEMFSKSGAAPSRSPRSRAAAGGHSRKNSAAATGSPQMWLADEGSPGAMEESNGAPESGHDVEVSASDVLDLDTSGVSAVAAAAVAAEASKCEVGTSGLADVSTHISGDSMLRNSALASPERVHDDAASGSDLLDWDTSGGSAPIPMPATEASKCDAGVSTLGDATSTRISGDSTLRNSAMASAGAMSETGVRAASKPQAEVPTLLPSSSLLVVRSKQPQDRAAPSAELALPRPADAGGKRAKVSAWSSPRREDDVGQPPASAAPQPTEEQRPAEQQGMAWAEPSTRTPPVRQQRSDPQYTLSEEDLMDNIGEKVSETSEPAGALFNTMERQLMQELALDSRSSSPKHAAPRRLPADECKHDQSEVPTEMQLLKEELTLDSPSSSPQYKTRQRPTAGERECHGWAAPHVINVKQAFVEAQPVAVNAAATDVEGSSVAKAGEEDGTAPHNAKNAWGTVELGDLTAAAAPPNAPKGAAQGRPSAWGTMEAFSPPPDSSSAGQHAEAGSDQLLDEALRVLVPESWDSDGDGPPDVARLGAAWPVIEKDLESASQAKEEEFAKELAGDVAAAELAISRKTDHIQQQLELRARSAAAKLDTAAAQRHRSLAWGVVNRAEGVKEGRQQARRKLLALHQRQSACQKETLRRALGTSPSAAVAATFVLDAEALEHLSTSQAVKQALEVAQGLFSALQVAAMRPATGAHLDQSHAMPGKRRSQLAAAIRPTVASSDSGGGRCSQHAWENESALHAHGKALHDACEVGVQSLCRTLNALMARLERLKQETPALEEELEAVLKNEEGLTKAQKRDKAMFEGQQEYGYERSLGLKLKEQTTQWEHRAKDAVGSVERVLRRRWRRRCGADKPRALQDLKAVREAIEQAESGLAAVRQEHKELTEAEAARLETERRQMQEQTQAMLSAALVVQQEKGRMNEAWAAPPKERSRLMRVALRRVRRLHHDMKNLAVANELKQQHSVLVYSLRMLEARLQTECPEARNEMEEGVLEHTAEQRQQLDDASRAFEEQLTRDLAALRASHAERMEFALARQAAAARRRVEEELADAIPAAQGALEASSWAANVADFAVEALQPFAVAMARLGAESFRHEELEHGPSDASGFGPKRLRLDTAIEATLFEIKRLQAAAGEAVVPPDKRTNKGDAEWEKAIARTAQQWKAFCDEHPVPLADDASVGCETPRSDARSDAHSDNHSDAGAPLQQTEALVFDDLDEQPALGKSGSRSTQKLSTTGRRGAWGESTSRSPGKDRRVSASSKPLPVAASSGKPPGAASQSVQNAPKTGPSRPPGRQDVGGVPAGPTSGGKDAAALLAQLDELSKTMDSALRGGTLPGPQGPSLGRAPPPARRPAAPPAHGRSRAA